MRHHSTLNNTDLNDTDEDSRQSIPCDDDDDIINQQSLMTELMNAEEQMVSYLFWCLARGGGVRDFIGIFFRTYARGSENRDFTAHVLYGCVSFVKSMFVFDVMVWMENLA